MIVSYHNEKDFKDLFYLLAEMVEAQAGLPIAEGLAWQNDRQILARKFLYHLSTVNTILHGTAIDVGSRTAHFVDHGSIIVLARAVIENFIVFAHVFGSSDVEQSRFKHMVWKYCGLKDRQRRVAITEEGRVTLAAERSRIAILLSEIKEHSIFKTFSNGKKKSIVNGDWAGGLKWHELAAEVGLNQRYFRNVYSYLCDYSHTSYAAVLQVGQAKSIEKQMEMSRSMLGFMNLTIARFIGIYATLFDFAQKVLDESAYLPVAIKWNFDATSFEKIYAERVVKES